MIRRLSNSDPLRSAYTRLHVRGDSEHIYLVTVDSDGLWTCDCPSNNFRGGICYHVLMVKTEIERGLILSRLDTGKIKPVRISTRDFESYLAKQRFIAEPVYAGPRLFVVFSRYVYLGKLRKMEWETPGYLKLAGTILEGAYEGYPKGSKEFKLFDCLYHNGIDYRYSPLAMRREVLEGVVKRWMPDSVSLSEYEYEEKGKQGMLGKWGCAILKDVNSPYVLSNRTPRAWMMKKNG